MRPKDPNNPSDSAQKNTNVLCTALFFFIVLLIAALVFIVLRWRIPLASGSETASSASTIEDTTPYATLLPKSPDAGQSYLDETFFVGDSNTLRMYIYDMLELENIAAKSSIGIQGLRTQPMIFFDGEKQGFTVLQALPYIQPRRIILNFGTNNIGSSVSLSSFIDEYRTCIKDLQSAAPYADIIIAAIAPIAEKNNYPKLTKREIEKYNAALLKMCKEEGLYFLNYTELLTDENGYAKNAYMESDGIHLTEEALRAMLRYTRTHALPQENDLRPGGIILPRREEPKRNY